MVWLQVAALSVRDEAGSILYSAGVIEDITVSKLAEERLRNSAQLLRLVIDTVPHHIAATNTEGQYLFANRYAAEMSGYVSPDEMVGQHRRDIAFEQSEQDRLFRENQRVIDSCQPRLFSARTITDGAGQSRIMQTTKVPFAFPGTRELSVLAVQMDITEQFRLQSEVLDIAMEEQRRIGHELHDGTQQELAGLTMLAGTLLDLLQEIPVDQDSCHGTRQLRPPQYEELGERAERLCQGLADANHNVQQLARGIIPAQIEQQGLQTALGQLASSTDGLKGVTCRFEGAETITVANHSTATNLYRIAQEAVTNALKHNQAKQITHSLTHSLTEAAEGITLSIHDDGIGFPDQPTSGSGHGWTSMRYRANLMGATLNIGSSVGSGTRITCALKADFPI